MTSQGNSATHDVMNVALVERLRKTAADLAEHRQTHVVWRDWLIVDKAREKVNPHAGSAEFHAGVILDYDRHLANIEDAIRHLTTRPSPEPTREMAAAFKKAHDEHAAIKIPKIYYAGQREEVNIIVGLRAALAARDSSRQGNSGDGEQGSLGA